jgi:hypothetical protein
VDLRESVDVAAIKSWAELESAWFRHVTKIVENFLLTLLWLVVAIGSGDVCF